MTSGTTDAANERWLANVRENWNERAPWWDEMSEANAVAPDRRSDIERIMGALAVRPGASLLDAGCGSGQFAIAFAHRGCHVTAVDLSPEMIARAGRHGAEAGVDVDWRVGDVSRLADPMAVYDAVHARVVLQFVPNAMATLTEFRRVLKPGGRLFASVPGALSPIYGRSWRRFLEPERTDTTYMVPWELEELLRNLGWALLDGWGEFGRNLGGDANPRDAIGVAALPLRLQQAAATTWAFVAR